MSLIYTGIGVKNTPEKILGIMNKLGRNLAERGHVLRSGANPKGPQKAFEEGCDANQGKKEIYLPWPGYQMRPNQHRENHFAWPTIEADTMVKQILPDNSWWYALSIDDKCLTSRTPHLVLGWELNKPSDLVIYWDNGVEEDIEFELTLKIAKDHKIPCINLVDIDSFDKLENFPGI